MSPHFRAASAADAEAIARIYNYYVRHTVITFEEEPVATQTMAARVMEVQNASLPWLVAELEGAVVGYAYASKWKVRSAYRYAVETTIYLEHGCEGRGIGRGLYAELLSGLRARGLHVAIGGAALPNDASALCTRNWDSSASRLFARSASNTADGWMSPTGSCCCDAALVARLKELAERTREIFILYRIENVTRQEIARAFALSLSSVEKEIARATAYPAIHRQSPR